MSRKKQPIKKFNKSLLPIMAIPFISLIMYVYHVQYSQKIIDMHIADGTGYYDLFAYWKMIAICVIGGYMLLSIVVNSKKYTIKKNNFVQKLYIPMAVYALFIILSIIFSKYFNFALFGMFERFEGGLVLLFYLIFVYYIVESIKEFNELKYVLYAVLAASAAVMLISFFQGLKIDPLATKTFFRLIGLTESERATSTFNPGWAYSTLYNPNYLGQFTALLLPALIGIFQYVKGIKLKVIVALIIILDIFSMYFAKSSSAYLAVIVSVLVFIAFNIKHIWEKMLLRVSFIALALAGIVMTVAVFTGFFGDGIIKYLDDKASINYLDEDDFYIDNIIMEKNKVSMVSNKFTLNMNVTDGVEEGTYNVLFTDGDDNYVVTSMSGNTMNFEEAPYKGVFRAKFYLEGYIDLMVRDIYGEGQIRFLYVPKEGIKGVVGVGNNIITELKPSNMPEKLIGYEKMFSRRLYMWAVSFMNLKDNIFIGDGPDTFRAAFDQTDIIGKINTYYSSVIIIDKPHNFFLQMAQGSGVISLLVFLFMIGAYLIWSFKLYFTFRYNEKHKVLGIFMSLSVISFLIAGFFTDSNVSVSPVFYLMLGLGISINYMVSKNQKAY